MGLWRSVKKRARRGAGRVVSSLGLDRLVLKGMASDVLAEALAQRLAAQAGNPVHDIFYRHGFHLLRKHYYLPIPDDTDRLDGFWDTQSAMVGVDTNDARALDLMENVLSRYLEEFRGRFPSTVRPIRSARRSRASISSTAATWRSTPTCSTR